MAFLFCTCIRTPSRQPSVSNRRPNKYVVISIIKYLAGDVVVFHFACLIRIFCIAHCILYRWFCWRKWEMSLFLRSLRPLPVGYLSSSLTKRRKKNRFLHTLHVLSKCHGATWALFGTNFFFACWNLILMDFYLQSLTDNVQNFSIRPTQLHGFLSFFSFQMEICNDHDDYAAHDINPLM